MSKRIIFIVLILALLVTACGGKTSNPADNPADTSTNGTTVKPQDSSSKGGSDDLSSALNLVLGTTDEPGVFDSYHIELVLDTPQANDDETAVVNEVVSISADVAGKNVHIFQVDPGMTEAKEGYIIGDNDKEYKLVDDAWQETMGQIGLGWAMWPLQVILPYAYSSSVYSNKTGNEEVNGRSAKVYELDTSKADPAVVSGMEAFGVGEMSGLGKVWIDNETGAMLKLDLEYTSEISSLDGSINLGTGNGHITLEISKIGEVTVTSPL